MKRLSIIVPVYNAGEFLRECLDSLLNQTLAGIEIILVDDGSTDESPSIIKEYKAKYPDSIVSVRQDNQGQGPARNSGYLLATGDYVTFVDSDDWVEADCYASLVEQAARNDADILCFDFYSVWPNRKPFTQITFETDGLLSRAGAIIALPAHPWDKIYRRAFLNEIEVSFARFVYEDLVEIYRFIACANKIYYINRPCYYYRRHIASTTGGLSPRSRTMPEALRALLKLADTYPDLSEELLYATDRSARGMLKILTKSKGTLSDTVRREVETIQNSLTKELSKNPYMYLDRFHEKKRKQALLSAKARGKKGRLHRCIRKLVLIFLSMAHKLRESIV